MIRFASRLYRVLLLLYPADFRRRYGQEMLRVFEADLHRAQAGGGAAVLTYWSHILGDLGASVWRRRVSQCAHILDGNRGTPRLPHHKKRTEMDTLLQDLRYAMRQFVRRPGFTAIAVVSLALAIGGNSLIYGIIDGFVFHPFPYPEPDRLISIGVTFPKLSSETSYIEVLSPAEYADIRTNRSFASVAAFDLGNRNVSGGDMPERVFTALLLDDLFPVIGMKPVLGRGFTREELGPNGATVAIISHRLWQTRFGGDPAILNRRIRVGGVTGSIVGVMPPGLLVIGTDLWVPWGGDPSTMPRNVRQFTILARLRRDASVGQANAELAGIAARIEQAESARIKEYVGWRLTATPWAAAVLQDIRPAGFMLIGAVGFVLLIACANVTNLFLARSTTRQRELAVRLALGAARWRLARQLLTESLLLAAAGGAIGLLLAFAGMKSAGALIPSQFQMLDLHAAISTRVLLWSMALAIASGLLVGLLPAFQATRTDPHESLKADGRSGGAAAGHRLRQVLVIAEIALSVVLLLGAGLLITSFVRIQRVDPGFDARGVLTMRLTLPRETYGSGEAITGFFERLVEDVRNVPSVTAAAVASQFPPSEPFSGQIDVEGAPASTSGTTLPTAGTTIISRGYFQTLRMPVLTGRTFDDRDRPGSQRTVVVNRAFANRFLAGRSAIGARLRMAGRGGAGPWSEIIGVVGDARNQGITAPVRPEVFLSMESGRDSWNQLFLLVRSDRPAAALLPDVRRVVGAIDPLQPVYAIQTLDEAMATSAFQQRVSALLLGTFAAVALVLAAIGIYGVMSYSVSARTQEMGVRLAIGAQRAAVMWLVLKQVLLLSVIGLAIGVGLLLVASRSLEGLLFGVRANDPATIAIVAAVLGAVSLCAAWIPAARASRVDPVVALRYE